MIDINDITDDQVMKWADRNQGMSYERYIYTMLGEDIENMDVAIEWFQTAVENSEYICQEFIDWMRDEYADQIVEQMAGAMA